MKKTTLVVAVVFAALTHLAATSLSQQLEAAGNITDTAVQPKCQLGCLDPEPDPDSEAPGLWLGENVAPTICNSYTDYDLDGLGDFCERELAKAFSPELFYWRFDNVGYEPKWAAQPWPGNVVRIFYALSYYEDLGPVVNCPQVGNNWLQCGPHYGDSEAIVLDVFFDVEVQHWKLQKAHLSRHESWDTWLPNSLFFPDKEQGYPRIWVARQKHANYRSDAACDSGVVT